MLRESGPSPQTSLMPADQQTPCPLTYLREFGAYGGCRDLGVIAFTVATALRSQWAGRTEEVADTLALLLVSLEQASQDRGSMTMASSLLLLPDPPSNMLERSAATTAFRQFPRLADQHWITTMIAYLEGMDQIANRREQLGGPARGNRNRRGKEGENEEEGANPAKGKATPKKKS